MSRAIYALLHSKDLRSSFSEAGREHIRKNYSLDRFGEEAASIFRSACLGLRGRGGGRQAGVSGSCTGALRPADADD